MKTSLKGPVPGLGWTTWTPPRVRSSILRSSSPNLQPDGAGTVLRWQVTTPAPRWAGPYMRWATRRMVNAILDGLTTEITTR